MSDVAIAQPPVVEDSSRRRVLRIAAWLVGILVVLVALRLAGIDVWGWFDQLWHTVTDISLGYVDPRLRPAVRADDADRPRLVRDPALRVPGRHELPHGARLLRDGRGAEQRRACEPRHVRHVADVRRGRQPARRSPGSSRGYAVQKIFYLVVGTPDLHLSLLPRRRIVRLPVRRRASDAVIEPPRAHACHHRRRDLPRRRARMRIFWRWVKKMWDEGQDRRRDPRRPARLREVGAPAAGRRLRWRRWA